MPAKISTQPLQPSGPSRSPSSRYPNRPAHTVSRANTSAIRAALKRRRADARPEEGEPKEGREDDVEAGDEAGARDRRPLEPRRLEADPEPEQRPEEGAGTEPGPSERGDATGAGQAEDAGRDQIPHRE